MNSASMRPDLIREFTPLVRGFVTIQWFATGSLINHERDFQVNCTLLGWIYNLMGE